MGADDEEFEKQLETMPGEPGVGLSVCYRNGRSIKEWCIGSYDWAWLCMCQPPWRKSLRAPPFFAKDDALPILVSLVMGLQHALAMMGGLITPPTLIANDGCLFNRDKELCDAKAYMISSSLITSGILTIVQVIRFRLIKGYWLGTGLISVMGTSFTFLPIAREITTGEFGPDGAGGKAGYGKFLGTCLVASLLEIALSFIPPRTLRKMFPPLVTGTCVTLIGAALCGTGMKYWGGGVFCSENTLSRAGPWHIASLTNGNPAAVHWPGNPGPQYCAGDNGDVALSYGDARYVGMGTLVLIVMIIFRTFGSPFIKNCNVILSLFLVYFISMGVSVNDKNFVTSEKIDLADTITFNWATTFPLGFSPEGILPILIGFVVSTVESIGDVGASCDASAIPSVGPDAESRIQGGLLADGVNSFFAALMTSPPNTTFSQNNGVIVMTRCASRAAGLACAFWLIVFGVFGKFAGIITSIPTCVLGGMVIFLFSNVMISGLAILSNVKFDNRNRFILAVSLGIGLGVACQPNMFDPAPSSPAAFYGVDLAHKIGFWPMDNVCKTFATRTVTVSPASCIWSSNGTDLSLGLDAVDCAKIAGTVYTPAVTEVQSKQFSADCFPSFGSGSNCCVEYDEGLKSLRTSILLILKTPYCIGTLLALLLNLIIPQESEPDMKDEIGKKRSSSSADLNVEKKDSSA